MEPMDALYAALQSVIDAMAEGWTVGHYAVVIGLEQFDGERVQSTVWTVTPVDQAEWMTKGLLDTATEIQLSVADTSEDE
jgi:hypothetical protein